MSFLEDESIGAHKSKGRRLLIIFSFIPDFNNIFISESAILELLRLGMQFQGKLELVSCHGQERNLISDMRLGQPATSEHVTIQGIFWRLGIFLR